jgi:hypothetical protein
LGRKAEKQLKEIIQVTGVLATILVILISLCAGAWPGIFSQHSYMDIKVIVEEAGYNDVKVVNWHPFLPAWNGCSSEDAVAYTVEAVTMSKDGFDKERDVNIAVCCGTNVTRFSKGCTVRVR